MSQEIDNESAFNWWVKSVLKKRLIIISLVKKRNALYLKNTHNFGKELPKSVSKAYSLDENNGNILWEDSIDK